MFNFWTIFLYGVLGCFGILFVGFLIGVLANLYKILAAKYPIVARTIEFVGQVIVVFLFVLMVGALIWGIIGLS